MATTRRRTLCYAKKLASFALQRDIVAADMPLLHRARRRQHGDRRLGQAGDAGARPKRRVPDPRRRCTVNLMRISNDPIISRSPQPPRVSAGRGRRRDRAAVPRGPARALGVGAERQPVFSFYIVAACGVVGKKFFPAATGALTTAALAGMTDKATACWRRTPRTCCSSRASTSRWRPTAAGTPRGSASR